MYPLMSRVQRSSQPSGAKRDHSCDSGHEAEGAVSRQAEPSAKGNLKTKQGRYA
jgi:hypothetical protein